MTANEVPFLMPGTGIFLIFPPENSFDPYEYSQMSHLKYLIAILLVLPTGCRNSTTDDYFDPDSEAVQVVLFHLSQRCSSCRAVEQVTLDLLSSNYGDEMENGKIRFAALDFRSENGKTAAKTLRASGQTLYVVKGDHVSNLSSEAFMFAETHPDRYRKALKKEIDKLLE